MIHFDKTKRDEAIAQMCVACNVQFSLSDDWEVLAIVDEKVLGGVMVKENEIHIAVIRKVFLRPLIRELFSELLSKYGSVVTKVRSENKAGQKFVERLGFKKISEDNVIYYALKEVNYA